MFSPSSQTKYPSESLDKKGDFQYKGGLWCPRVGEGPKYPKMLYSIVSSGLILSVDKIHSLVVGRINGGYKGVSLKLGVLCPKMVGKG